MSLATEFAIMPHQCSAVFRVPSRYFPRAESCVLKKTEKQLSVLAQKDKPSTVFKETEFRDQSGR